MTKSDRPEEGRETLPLPPKLMPRLLTLAGFLVLGLLAWYLSGILLLVFASLIVATIFGSLADLLDRYTPLNRQFGLVLSVLVVAVLIGVFLWLLGAQLRTQILQLTDQLPKGVTFLENELGINSLRDHLMQMAGGAESLAWDVFGYTTTLASALTKLLLVLVSGLFLAAQPEMYRRGTLLLFPTRVRPRVEKAISAAGEALRLWLLGKILMMVIVFAATTAGLYLLNAPSALALGLLAGLLEFIPFFGPILAAIPALLVATSAGWGMVLWVLGLYVVIQQIENNVLVPVIQHHTVELPPVLGLFSIFAFGVLFGTLGVLLAVPLTVVVLVLVKQLYLNDMLQENVPLFGHREKKKS